MFIRFTMLRLSLCRCASICSLGQYSIKMKHVVDLSSKLHQSTGCTAFCRCVCGLRIILGLHSGRKPAGDGHKQSWSTEILVWSNWTASRPCHGEQERAKQIVSIRQTVAAELGTLLCCCCYDTSCPLISRSLIASHPHQLPASENVCQTCMTTSKLWLRCTWLADNSGHSCT